LNCATNVDRLFRRVWNYNQMLFLVHVLISCPPENVAMKFKHIS